MDQDPSNVNRAVPNLPPNDLAKMMEQMPGMWVKDQTIPNTQILEKFQAAQTLLTKKLGISSQTKESQTPSGNLSNQTKLQTPTSEDSGQPPNSPSKTSSSTSTPNTKSSKIHINFDRKVCPEAYLLQMQEVFKAENLISGNAFEMVLKDLVNLRRMCEAIVLAKENGDDLDLKKMVDILKIIL